MVKRSIFHQLVEGLLVTGLKIGDGFMGWKLVYISLLFLLTNTVVDWLS